MYLVISSNKGEINKVTSQGKENGSCQGRQKTSIAAWSSQNQLQCRWNVFTWQNSCLAGNLPVKIWPNHTVVNAINEKTKHYFQHYSMVENTVTHQSFWHLAVWVQFPGQWGTDEEEGKRDSADMCHFNKVVQPDHIANIFSDNECSWLTFMRKIFLAHADG